MSEGQPLQGEGARWRSELPGERRWRIPSALVLWYSGSAEQERTCILTFSVGVSYCVGVRGFLSLE